MYLKAPKIMNTNCSFPPNLSWTHSCTFGCSSLAIWLYLSIAPQSRSKPRACPVWGNTRTRVDCRWLPSQFPHPPHHTLIMPHGYVKVHIAPIGHCKRLHQGPSFGGDNNAHLRGELISKAKQKAVNAVFMECDKVEYASKSTTFVMRSMC
jgi:hypothetical protein